MVFLPFKVVTLNLEIENHAHYKIQEKERKANKDDCIDLCPYSE